MTDWWERPQLRRDEDEGNERKVGFLDLFYDLVFVVAIAQLAHGLAKHPDVNGAITFGLLFAPVWWLWMSNTFYTDRFDTEDVSHRLFTFLQMLPVVGIALFAHGARGDTATAFILSYVAGRVLLIGLWMRAGYHDPVARPVTSRYSIGFGIGTAIWVASIFVDEPLRAWMWLAALATDLIMPLFAVEHEGRLPKFSQSRMTERIGLFTIIVLGESVAGTVNGLTEIHHLTLIHGATALLAMAFAFALYWIYFEMVPRENLKPGIWPHVFRSFIHLPLLAAIAASGAGILGVLGQEGDLLAAGPRRVLAWSVTITMVCMIGLSRIHEYQPFFKGARRRTEVSLGLAAGVSLALGVTDSVGAVRLLLILWLVLMLPVVWGIYSWAQAIRSNAAPEEAAIAVE